MSHGEPCFFVRDKRTLCYYHDDHNRDGRISFVVPGACGCPRGDGERRAGAFLCAPPRRRAVCFGVARVYLDTAGEAQSRLLEVAAIVEDAYRHVAPKSLVAELDNR